MQTKYILIQNQMVNAVYVQGDYNKTTDKWNGVIKVFQASFDKKYDDIFLGEFEGDFTGLSLSGEGVFRGRFQDYIKMMTETEDNYSYNGEFFYNFVHKYKGSFYHAVPDGLGRLYSVPHQNRFDYVHDKEKIEALIFKGEFKEGYIQGKGIQYSLDGKKYYEGDWFTLHENESADPASSYKTNKLFLNNYKINDHMSMKFHGTGKFYFENKLLYSGEWYYGRFHGTGTLYNLKNGTPYYTGTWRYGSPHGIGIEYRPNGMILYKGYWIDGMKHGWGTLYDAEGEVLFFGKMENSQR
ncbi:hypothetical protein [Bacillus sp. REN16]|uniref:hypothetical protein n=1 Tax=Bacillus sp. REN16 TaxID=2887296 RepID=UPI001E44B198|nr:hypothetical protein [Bacillus sp. REN16]MCC3356771.1 hypothetical protein [Bacillus sp. REN16]